MWIHNCVRFWCGACACRGGRSVSFRGVVWARVLFRSGRASRRWHDGNSRATEGIRENESSANPEIEQHSWRPHVQTNDITALDRGPAARSRGHVRSRDCARTHGHNVWNAFTFRKFASCSCYFYYARDGVFADEVLISRGDIVEIFIFANDMCQNYIHHVYYLNWASAFFNERHFETLRGIMGKNLPQYINTQTYNYW